MNLKCSSQRNRTIRQYHSNSYNPTNETLHQPQCMFSCKLLSPRIIKKVIFPNKRANLRISVQTITFVIFVTAHGQSAAQNIPTAVAKHPPRDLQQFQCISCHQLHSCAIGKHSNAPNLGLNFPSYMYLSINHCVKARVYVCTKLKALNCTYPKFNLRSC